MPASTTLLPSQRLCGIVHEILRLLSSASQAALAGAINDVVEDTTNAVELYKKLFVLLSSTAENLADATTPLVAGVTETHAHHEQTNSTSPQPSSGHNDRLAARGQLIDQVDKMIAWTRKVCQEDASTANTSAFKSVVVELSASTKRVFVLENARLEKAYVCTNCGLALDAECVACDRPHSGTHAWFHRACVSLAPGQFECMPWTCSNECGNSQEDIAGQDLYPDESVSNVVSKSNSISDLSQVGLSAAKSSVNPNSVAARLANDYRQVTEANKGASHSPSSSTTGSAVNADVTKSRRSAAEDAKRASAPVSRPHSFLGLFKSKRNSSRVSTLNTSFGSLNAALEAENVEDESALPTYADDYNQDRFDTDSILSDASSDASTTASNHATDVSRTIRILLHDAQTSFVIETRLNNDLAAQLLMCSKAEEKHLTQRLKASDGKLEQLTQAVHKYQRQLGDTTSIGKELAEKQFKAIEALLEKMQDHPHRTVGGPRMATLAFQQARAYFFLRSVNWSVTDAYKKLCNHIEWYRSNQPNLVPSGGFYNEAEDGRFYAHKHDRHGNLAVFFRMRYHVVGLTDYKDILRHWLHVVDKLLATSENPYQQLVWLYDRRDSTRKNSDVKMMKILVRLLNEHYPERVCRIYVLNADATFRIGYKIVKTFLSKMDQDRFCILSRKEAKWKAFLVSEFGKENLQVDLGGTDPYVHAPSSSSAAQVSTSSDRAIERTHSVDSTDTLPAEPAEPTDESGMTLNPIALQQYAVQRRASLLDNLEHNLNVSRTRTDSLIKTMESDLQSLRNSFEKGRPSALKSVPEAS